jgi:hypothetical protein
VHIYDERIWVNEIFGNWFHRPRVIFKFQKFHLLSGHNVARVQKKLIKYKTIFYIHMCIEYKTDDVHSLRSLVRNDDLPKKNVFTKDAIG